MAKKNIVKVKGNCGHDVFTLDKSTGLVTFTGTRPVFARQWNEALQWLPVKSLSNDSLDKTWFNFLTLELTTGEVVRLCDRGNPAGTKYMYKDQEYLCIGRW